MLSSIVGPEGLIVVAVIALVFGASRLPKLARSLGSAKSELERAARRSDAGEPGRDAA